MFRQAWPKARRIKGELISELFHIVFYISIHLGCIAKCCHAASNFIKQHYIRVNIQYKRGHIPSLDGIRGIAILLVLFFHCFSQYPYPINAFSTLGWTGVDLFFVLSGFLITGILVDAKDKPFFFRNFFMKRVLRIFPLYYLSLIGFFLYAALADPERYAYYLDNQLFFWTYTQNMLFAFEGWPKLSPVLTHYWSLAIEEQFYLFWPFVIAFLNKRKILLSCALLIGVSLLTRNLNTENPFSYVFTLARFDSLLIGAGAAILIREYPRLLNRMVLPVFIISAIALLAVIFIGADLTNKNILMVRVGYTLLALFFCCLIISVFDQEKIGKGSNVIFGNKILIFFGKYSYGIYVYHWLFYRDFFLEWIEGYHLGFLESFIYVAGVVLLSVLSFHLIEKRFLALKKQFA